MHAQMRLHSRTGAMRDVFESRRDELNEYLKAVKYLPHQKGLLAFINGEVAGFDIISLESAYEILHAKLVKSYALDALLQKKDEGDGATVDKARAFLEETVGCEEKIYESIGLGWDHRFQGKTTVGSALVHREIVIHAAFFRTTEGDKAGKMSECRRRRGFKM